MTDQTIPADKVRKIVNDMRRHADHDAVRGTEEEYTRHFIALLEALLPPRPTLADMAPEERGACQWTHADVKVADMTPEERPACGRMHSDVILSHHVVILNHHEEDGRARVLWLCGCDKPVAWEKVTPRTVLPSMAWPSDQKSDN